MMSHLKEETRKKDLGSAKDGTHHAIFMRLSAIALLPLLPWFAVDFVPLITASRAVIISWLENPLRLGLLILFFALGTQHGAAGLQNIYDDYLHNPFTKMVAIAVTRYGSLALTIILGILLLRIHLGFIS